MWVIKNKVTGLFFAGWSGWDTINTTASIKHALHYSDWDTAAADMGQMTNNWKILPLTEINN